MLKFPMDHGPQFPTSPYTGAIKIADQFYSLCGGRLGTFTKTIDFFCIFPKKCFCLRFQSEQFASF